MRSGSRLLFTFLLSALIFSTAALAQSGNINTGTISGRVTDTTGAGLPGVTLTATSLDTGLLRRTVSGAEGDYVVQLLPPGRYRLDAELSGIGKVTVPNITVLLGSSTNSDIRLSPTVSREITVTTTTPIVDPTESGLTSSVTEKQIQNLPILGRDFRTLSLLTPGVDEAFGSRVTSNGGRGITTDFNIDGAESNSDFFGEQTGGTRAPFTFSEAAIQEFQVIRSQYNAEYARGVGATINAITKSGTNETTGQVFTFYRDAAWASSRPLTVNSQSQADTFHALSSTQPGFAVGGPLVSDRLFYFVNGDFQRQNQPITIGDVRTTSAFLALPADQQAAFLDKYQSLVGHPYADELNFNESFNQNTWLAKIDANLDSKNHLSFRDNYSSFTNGNNQGADLLSNQGTETDKFNQAVIQDETVVSSSLFNQLIAQYSNEERPISANTTDIPEIRLAIGTSTLFFGQNDFLPNNTTEKKYQIKDNLSWVWKNHTFKTGLDLLWDNVDDFFPRFQQGQYQYSTVANFLADHPSFFAQGQGPSNGHEQWDQNTYGGFIQDSIRLFTKLSVDVGVRYDVQTMPKPTTNITPYPEFVSNFKEDRNNIAPRLGFAYDLKGDGRSVIRGGTGEFFNYLPSILYANPLFQIAGAFNQISVNCATATCPTFPTIFDPSQFSQIPPSSRDITIISNNFQAEQSWRTSLGFEQQIGVSYAASLEGSYSDITHVQRLRNINAVANSYTFGNLPVYNVTDPNRPFPQFQNVLAETSDESASNRTVSIETHKLALNNSKVSWTASYTWSKSIDEDTNERSTSTAFSYDPYDPSLSRGPSDNDIRHRVVLSGTYQLPWQMMVSGIYNWHTGVPYTIGIGNFSDGLASITGDYPVFVDSSGQIIDLTQASGMTRPQLAAFLNAQGATLIGRNTARQPDFSDLDLRLSKTISVGRYGVEIIGEVFNALNQKNLFLTTATTRPFVATFNAGTDKFTFTKNANYGIANSYSALSTPRQYQIAAKIRF